MRLDRFVTLKLVRPFRRAFSDVGASEPALRDFSVPVLMYHSICDELQHGVSAYHQTCTSPAVFRQHMQFLADHNYRTITVDELINFLSASEPSTLNSGSTIASSKADPSTVAVAKVDQLVAITFDDGFQDFYTEAFPVLQEYGFSATVFLPTAFIGDHRRKFAPGGPQSKIENRKAKIARECLTWSEVRELRKSGIHFGSHTVTHPRLVELAWPEIERQLRDSRVDLEQHLGESIVTFAHPFAFPQADREYVNGFRELLSQAGYKCCATTEVGRVSVGDDIYRLKRLPMNGLDDERLFQAKLEGGYDWLAGAQSMVKRTRQILAHSPHREPLISKCAAAGCS